MSNSWVIVMVAVLVAVIAGGTTYYAMQKNTLSGAKSFCLKSTSDNKGKTVQSLTFYENSNGTFADCGIGNDLEGGHMWIKMADSKWQEIWPGSGKLAQEDPPNDIIQKYSLPIVPSAGQ